MREKAHQAKEKALLYVSTSRASDLFFFAATSKKRDWLPALHESVENALLA